jgi:hypothetical protein
MYWFVVEQLGFSPSAQQYLQYYLKSHTRSIHRRVKQTWQFIKIHLSWFVVVQLELFPLVQQYITLHPHTKSGTDFTFYKYICTYVLICRGTVGVISLSTAIHYTTSTHHRVEQTNVLICHGTVGVISLSTAIHRVTPSHHRVEQTIYICIDLLLKTLTKHLHLITIHVLLQRKL